MKKLLIAAALAAATALAHADAVQTLRGFVRDVKTGRAEFTQTVSSPDGARRKVSTGRFEFARPDRFRFVYEKPFQQTIVADGQKVWIHDPDLNQVSSRRVAQALGATPAALLAGGSLDEDFALSNGGSDGGLDWANAMPRAADGPFRSMKVGFRGSELAAVEIVDGFGQRSRLDFRAFEAGVALPADRFRFVVPAGADVLEQ